MKTLNIKTILIPIFFSFIWLVPSSIADTSHNHDVQAEQGVHDHAKMKKEQTQEYFHQSFVQGNQLNYKLIDMRKKGKNSDIQSTHHLMLLIVNDGNPVKPQKAGFLITGPDGKIQKVMAMRMGDSVGANINLSHKGEYTIKVKADVKGKILLDSLTYTMK